MQNKNTQPQLRLSNGIQSLLNRVLLVFSVCLISSAQAASGTRITQEAYHQSSALYTETAADMTVQTASLKILISYPKDTAPSHKKTSSFRLMAFFIFDHAFLTGGLQKQSGWVS